MPVEYSFTGRSFDKSSLASGLILEDEDLLRYPGKYVVTARVGNIIIKDYKCFSKKRQT